MPELLRDVRCRGCLRQLGVGKDDRVIYCDAQCANDFPASQTEARDALLEAVYLTHRYTFAKLGEMFGFSRQNAQQIVTKRDVRRVA